ncbi:MAG TPA: adenine phosphoribosyltransferase [Candidatus Binataceae bacterium]|jgi:adenine phosphoribosyltransferase|nr:adenine phosphoribosyltransferase [Candidatus Binataceae bacterium]
MTPDQLKQLVRDIPDFPKPGVMFRDITPLIADPRGLAAIVDQLAEPFLGKIDMVLGIESRGFIIGAPVAYRLGVGLAIARKPGKLPFRTVDEIYELEYGSATLQIHQDGFQGSRRILIVDDLLATGGTARAAGRLAERLGGEVVDYAFVIELNALGGRERLAPINCFSLIQYD